MRISIDPLDKQSIKRAAEQLRRYEKVVNSPEMLIRLAEVGKAAAEAKIAEAWAGMVQPASAEPPVMVIDTSQVGDGIIGLHMVGEEAGFVEFGTSESQPAYNSTLKGGYVPPERGSYGRHQGRESVSGTPAHWRLPGKAKLVSYGNPPAYAMDAAMQAMIQAYPQIAKEMIRNG